MQPSDEWKWKLKYEDGEEVDEVIDKKTEIERTKNKKADFQINDGHTFVSVPVNGGQTPEMSVENHKIGKKNVKVRVLKSPDPLTVIYILPDIIIKAEDPTDTTFEKEYYGSND